MTPNVDIPGSALGPPGLMDESIVGSPLKKHRASVYGTGDESKRANLGFPLADVLGAAEGAERNRAAQEAEKAAPVKQENEMEEEL